jgi:light-regulated signal transduction histidine kinase (bacteriophytochrome)
MLDLSNKDVSHVNHAIKNALASLSAYVQLLKRASDNGDTKKIGEITRKLERQSETVTNMVMTVGEWIKLTRQPADPMEEAYDLAELLAVLVSKYTRIYPEVSIVFEDTTIPCIGDRDKTTMAMARILEFLIVQMPEGGGIRLEMQSATSHCTIHIIGSRAIKNLFLPTFFEPLGIKTMVGNQQTGLEMTLVKAWIEAQGGSVTVSNEENISLTVTLPRKSAHT